MKTSTNVLICLLPAALSLGLAFAAAPTPQAPVNASSSSTEAKALYWRGHKAISEGDWVQADARFAELKRILMDRDGADAALYWRAYALSRAGRIDEAQALVERLRNEHRGSRWIVQAERLQDVGKASAGDGLEALLGQPADRALPKLTELLRNAPSEQTRRRALFVLSQIDDPRALREVTATTRSRDAALAAQAVHLLGVAGAQEQLRQVYDSSSDPKIRQRALQALGVAGAKAALGEVAGSDADAATRRVAVQAMGVAGDAKGLARIAAGDRDNDVRREAIRALGVAGAQKQLLDLYPLLDATPELRAEVLAALRVAGDERDGLLTLYKAAKTPQEKQALLQTLKSIEK